MEFGSFQSIFQLSAGLTTGISGLLTVWDDPVLGEAKKLAVLHKRAKKLSRDYRGGIKKELQDRLDALLVDISEKEDSVLLQDGGTRFYNLVRFLSLMFSIFSVSMLFISSMYPKSEMSIVVLVSTWVIAAFPPMVVIALAIRTQQILRSIKGRRQLLDNLYVDITSDAVAHTKRMGPGNGAN